MAKFIPHGKRFQPGQSGNPRGAALHNPVRKRLKKLTVEQLEFFINLVFMGDIENLQAVSKDTSSTVLQVWLACIAMVAIKKGDVVPLLALLERLFGKMSNSLNISGVDGGVIKVQNMSDEELKLESDRLAAILGHDEKK